MNKKDKLYAQEKTHIDEFKFDADVARVFQDMIQRSVPGYEILLEGIGIASARYARAGSNIYDLGCSLGAASLAISQYVQCDCKVMAIDNSQDMMDRCQAYLQKIKTRIPIHALCADVTGISIEKASVVVINLTLQFIAADNRLALLKNIYQGLLPGGILILSEKLSFADTETDRTLTDLHHDFKKAKGYSDLEISQKRTSLENVLIAESLATHQARLKQAGFQRVIPWFQYFNFASIVAFK